MADGPITDVWNDYMRDGEWVWNVLWYETAGASDPVDVQRRVAEWGMVSMIGADKIREQNRRLARRQAGYPDLSCPKQDVSS